MPVRPPDSGEQTLKKLLLIPAALVLLLALLPLSRPSGPPPHALDGRVAGRLAGDGPLFAGAAKVPVLVLPEAPLAGYPGFAKAEEPGKPVHARAIALRSGSALAWIVSLDALLIPPGQEADVLRRANLPDGTCLLLAATHTHSGPGGTWRNFVAERTGNGTFDEDQRKQVVRAIAEAMQGAQAALAPAELSLAREDWAAGPARPRSEGPIDPELLALRLHGAGGKPLATLVGYAMHPTSVPRPVDRASGDWPAVAATRLEALTGAPALVVQGAVGNTTWNRELHGPAPLGEQVAAEATRLLASAPQGSDARLSCETRLVSLPAFEAPRTVWARTLVTNLLLRWAPAKWAAQTRLSLGGVTLIGVPGEPVGELGLRAKPAFVVGLADGYLGYVETAARWQAGRGEAGKTEYGPSLARVLGLE